MCTEQFANKIQQLHQHLEDAIETLLPYFEIDSWQTATFRKPIIILKRNTPTRASYDMKKCVFIFREDDDTTINASSIGEEASHYIHAEINPLYKSYKSEHRFDYKLFFSATNLVELVGRYGALIYCQQKGVTVEQINWSDLLLAEGDAPFIGMTHYTGYKRAEEIFNRYGAKKLARIARMSIEEAQLLLPRIAPIGFYERRLLPLIDKLLKREITKS